MEFGKGNNNERYNRLEEATRLSVEELFARVDGIHDEKRRKFFRGKLKELPDGILANVEGLLDNLIKREFSNKDLKEQFEHARDEIAENWTPGTEPNRQKEEQADSFLRSFAENIGVELDVLPDNE